MSRKTPLAALLVAVVLASAWPAVAAVRDRSGTGGDLPHHGAATHAGPAEPVGVLAAVLPALVWPPPIELLRAWDARRAEAWARGSPHLLRPLYTHGSQAGRRDRAMLRAWVGRGLTVTDLHTQLLAVRVLGRTASSWTLQVTDRVVGGTAAADGHRWPLPRDGATSRTVRLRWVQGAWRVAAVLPAGG